MRYGTRGLTRPLNRETEIGRIGRMGLIGRCESVALEIDDQVAGTGFVREAEYYR